MKVKVALSKPGDLKNYSVLIVSLCLPYMGWTQENFSHEKFNGKGSEIRGTDTSTIENAGVLQVSFSE